jgi:hypothetical protein
VRAELGVYVDAREREMSAMLREYVSRRVVLEEGTLRVWASMVRDGGV